VPATKPATVVDHDTPIVVAAGDRPDYASRGGHKLAAALAAFGAAEPPLRVAGRRCLDAGASTGGFTDVLLRAGAAEVVAVDVGYGQLLWRVRAEPRVRVLDRTNVRYLTPEQVGDPVEVVTADLSFISLTTVLPALRACARPDADLVLLVKPQFEVGRARLGSGGVVRDRAARADAVRTVAAVAADLGLGARGLIASPLPGPAGNLEYLLWLAAGAPPLAEADLADATDAGPPAPEPGPAVPPETVERSTSVGPAERSGKVERSMGVERSLPAGRVGLAGRVGSAGRSVSVGPVGVANAGLGAAGGGTR
jgi:23S rRNA (cytidine1920-2'-O)/16S rRNA (cytidine1409-2'-O)-methyltransferase